MQQLNQLLANRSYLEGYQPTFADSARVFSLDPYERTRYPHVFRWERHILSFSEQLRRRWPMHQSSETRTAQQSSSATSPDADAKPPADRLESEQMQAAAQIGAKAEPQDPTFVKWMSIGGLHNLVATMGKCMDYKAEHGEGFAPYAFALERQITYRGKVKLHGQNGGVVITKTGLETQSRSTLTGRKKCGELVYGAESTEAYFRSLHQDTYSQTIIFGEWCGPGVQKGVALAQLDKKIFAVFCVWLDSNCIVDPDAILRFMTKDGAVSLPEGVYVLPWHTEAFPLSLLDEKQMQPHVDMINTTVGHIDESDPWVKEVFGVEGNGEGLVLYPVNFVNDDGLIPANDFELFEAFTFKAKGDKHTVVDKAKPAQLTSSVADGVADFAQLMMPEVFHSFRTARRC